MGYLTPKFKKAIIDDLIHSIISNTSQYYAFVANDPSVEGEAVPDTTHDVYNTSHINNWNMLFGKKIGNTNIMPIIYNNVWKSGNIYKQYNSNLIDDNSLEQLNPQQPNTFFYVTRQVGGVKSDIAIYKCIDNANNSPSTHPPDQLENSTFQKDDGYKWRWITTIKYSDYEKFASENYIPVYPSSTVTSSAFENASIDKIVIENAGSGYVSYSIPININRIALANVIGGNATAGAFEIGDFVYQTVNLTSEDVIANGYVYGIDTVNSSFSIIQVKLPENNMEFISNTSYPIFSVRNGEDNRDNYGYVGSNSSITYEGSKNFVQSVSNSTVIQIENYESLTNDFYSLNSIYIYNTDALTSQLKNIKKYVSNNTGKWVYLDEPANTVNIIPNSTKYQISPRVKILSDGLTNPRAYSTVNTMTNSIESITIINPGSGISWADAIIVSNTVHGNGAVLQTSVPTAGGHGSSPESELYVQGISVYFNFAGTEDMQIPSYYERDVAENPVANTNVVYNRIGIIKDPNSIYSNGVMGTSYTGDYFNSVIKMEVTTPVIFPANTLVIGQNSGSVARVLHSNTTFLTLAGDKDFIDNENILGEDNITNTNIVINTLGDIYTKNLEPLYYQNINKVTRADDKSESFKMIIQI